MAGEEVATCPSCSLVVKVIYDLVRQRITNIITNKLFICNIGSKMTTTYKFIPLIIFVLLQEKFKAEAEELSKEDGDKETVKA